MDDQEQQELMWKASFLEKQAQEVQEHLTIINQEIESLYALNDGLKSLQKSTEKKIIASIGKGVHVQAHLASKDLLVDVGANVLVKKTPAETQIVIEQQVKKLVEARMQLLEKLEIYQETLQAMLNTVEHTHGHKH